MEKGEWKMNQYVCHVTVNVFDGVSTLAARTTDIVSADSQKEAMEAVRKQVGDGYEKINCKVNSIQFALIKQV